MSLIHHLLKKLESKKVQQTLLPVFTKKSKTATVASYLPYTPLFLFILFNASMACFLLLKSLKQIPTTTVPPPLKVTSYQKTPLVENKLETKWLTSLVTGISLQVNDEVAELSLMLDHPVFYRILLHPETNQLVLILENSKIQAELPNIRPLTTAIQSIKTAVQNNNTQLIFTLDKDAELKYVKTNNNDKDPQLLLAIQSKHPLQHESSNDSFQSLKKPAFESLMIEHYQTALDAAKYGRTPEAIKELSALLKMDPNFNEARASLVALLISHHDYQEAEKLVDEGIGLNNDYIPFIELKSRLLIQTGKSKQALALLQSVAPSISDYPDYYGMMAALYERNNNDAIAVKLYKELIMLNPGNGNWWFGLGVSLEKLGENRQAFDAYTKAITQGKIDTRSMAYLQDRLRILQEVSHEDKD